MKLIKTFIDGRWQGFQPMKEIIRLRSEFNRIARERQAAEPADHRVYAHYDLVGGKVVAAWFYSDEVYTDAEFDRVAGLTDLQVFAIHARK